jgi:hypothetical protein
VLLTVLVVLAAQAAGNSLKGKSGAIEIFSTLGTILEIVLTVCDSLGWKRIIEVEVPEVAVPIIEMRTRNFWKSLQWLA